MSAVEHAAWGLLADYGVNSAAAGERGKVEVKSAKGSTLRGHFPSSLGHGVLKEHHSRHSLRFDVKSRTIRGVDECRIIIPQSMILMADDENKQCPGGKKTELHYHKAWLSS